MTPNRSAKSARGFGQTPSETFDVSAFLAHLRQDGSTTFEHSLVEHLRNVSVMAERFAQTFGAGDLGKLAGLWHDLGKYCAAFQKYLRSINGEYAHLEGMQGTVDHSTAGAKHAFQYLKKTNPFAAHALAYSIAGHHAGLANWFTDSDASLACRLAKEKPETADALRRVPEDLLQQPSPGLPRLSPSSNTSETPFQAAMLIRMVFSCLTDADFLDTEIFMAPDRTQSRYLPLPMLEELDKALNRFLHNLSGRSTSPMSARRREILDACRNSAFLEPGFFSLTVPTGGGKTLSSLAFALRHAIKFNRKRVVYAIPFTSIIEQNADVFRRVFAGLSPQVVLEHHCNLAPQKITPWTRLACENWDAPLIVTTNIQLFESLFSNRGSHCRKLHNLAQSVIILDEAQSIPVNLLHPCLAALRELVRNYQCSIVLCTATQPAIHRRKDFSIGLENVREITPDPARLYTDMKRVSVSYLDKISDEELARRLIDEQQVLCIVNSKRHAAELFRRLPQDGNSFHLSTNMCPRHRSDVLRRVQRRLKINSPCRLISTSLIEAGVDIDFPVVYRAIAGLDSIAQAAGRCNREGRRKTGHVYVFESEKPPFGNLRQAADTTKELTGKYDDLLGLQAVERYFELHYWKKQDGNGWDQERIMNCFRTDSGNALLCDFRQASDRFKMISQPSKPVFIPYRRQGQRLAARFSADDHYDRDDLRLAQRFMAQVYEGTFARLENRGLLTWVSDLFPILLDPENNYSSDTGMSPGDDLMIF